jgi:Family of unknown function (DUF5329)
MAAWTGLALAVASLALAASPPAPSRADAEIGQLLEALKTSGCRFQRNGTWYDAPQAAEHLGTKRVYLNRANRIQSAEDFIRLAGTESSMSGKAYRVACPGKPEVDSKAWLESELGRIRGSGPKTTLDLRWNDLLAAEAEQHLVGRHRCGQPDRAGAPAAGDVRHPVDAERDAG